MTKHSSESFIGQDLGFDSGYTTSDAQSEGNTAKSIREKIVDAVPNKYVRTLGGGAILGVAALGAGNLAVNYVKATFDTYNEGHKQANDDESQRYYEGLQKADPSIKVTKDKNGNITNVSW